MQIHHLKDREHLTQILRSLRPDWEEWLISSVLQSHSGTVALADMVIAATRYAADPRNKDPRGIRWRGVHWSGLDTQPATSGVDQSIRCYVCGKPEDKCLTQRPGPDDHDFEPARREDLAVIR